MEKLILKQGHALCICIAVMMLTCFNNVLYASDPRVKPRVIVTTDGEIDDRQSMIRFFMYATDYDVDGIVEVNSKYQKSGHSGEKWIQGLIDKYGQVLPNLLKHNSNFPSVSHLKSVMRVGNENINDLYKAPPSMSTKNTAGEKLIIQKLLDSDPRPVHVLSWGGANTTASALWRLKYSGEYTSAQFNYAVSKIRCYFILYQDGGCQWIEDNVKEALIVESYDLYGTWDYQSITNKTVNPTYIQAYMTAAWLDAHVKKNHGVLGAASPQKYVSEGDSPSFYNLINNGLQADVDYTLGGWGGRSIVESSSKPNHLNDDIAFDDGLNEKSMWRWIPDAQNDFQARMDWCVASSFSGANHPPVAVVPGSNVRTVGPGQTVTLDATGSSDPDGNSLTYKWWHYYDADNSNAKVTINNSTSKTDASFVVPNEPNKQVHIILEVIDNGTPSLKNYQRLIFNINPSGNTPPSVSLTSPANDATFAAPASITITASASDPDGNVSKVEFYNGSTLIGSDASAPYSFVWTNVGAGAYNLTARATDNRGATTTSSARAVTVQGGGCTPTTITPSVQINGGAWVTTSTATLDAGGTVAFSPQPSSGGSWSWRGPNNFTATSRQITLNNVQTSQAGNYIATYTNPEGCTSSLTFGLTVGGSGCNQTAIIPHVKVNNGKWVQTSNATLNAGGTVKFGPHPTRGGSWSWSGPNGYTASTQEITLSNVQANQAGNYVATYTNAEGCKSTHTFVVIVNGSARITNQENNVQLIYPNPSAGSFLVNAQGKFSYQINDSMGNVKEKGDGVNEEAVGESLSPGVYELLINSAQGTKRSKLIKQ